MQRRSAPLLIWGFSLILFGMFLEAIFRGLDVGEGSWYFILAIRIFGSVCSMVGIVFLASNVDYLTQRRANETTNPSRARELRSIDRKLDEILTQQGMANPQRSSAESEVAVGRTGMMLSDTKDLQPESEELGPQDGVRPQTGTPFKGFQARRAPADNSPQVDGLPAGDSKFAPPAEGLK